MNTENRNFSTLLETVLMNVWGDEGDRLSTTRLKETRKALAHIRAIYRFRSERGAPQPSNINYSFKKNRAGYLAAFGERHAFLSFLHMKQTQAAQPEAIPQPRGKRNELVVTSLGAGSCVELYGICLYYLGDRQQNLYLKLNSLEKEREWVPNRHIVLSRVLKTAFPKLDYDPTDIDADLKTNAVPTLSSYYDKLVQTDILMIYNVMNEIPTTYVKQVWRNIKFLLDIFQRPVLILLMEPSAERAEPRIQWLKERLLHESTLIETGKEALFAFNAAPVCISMDSVQQCLNYRLFGKRIDGSKSNFGTTLQRSHMSCVKQQNSPLTIEQVANQLTRLEIKRGRKGKFHQHGKHGARQRDFGSIDEEWKKY